MSYLSDGGVYELNDQSATRLMELENSDKVYPLPADFETHLVTTADGVVEQLHKMGFQMPDATK